MLAAVIAEDASRKTMLKPVGRDPPSLHGEELNKKAETAFLSEFENCKSDMRWGGFKEGVTNVEAKAVGGYLKPTNVIHWRCFSVKGHTQPEKKIGKGLDQRAETHQGVRMSISAR